MGLVLQYTSISEMILCGPDEAGWRHCINIAFWILTSASVLLAAFAGGGSLAGADPSITSAAKAYGRVVRMLTFLYSSAFVAIAHRKMHVVSIHLREPRSYAMVCTCFSLHMHRCTRIYHALWSQVVRKHAAEKTKPALIIKMEGFCSAIWRYFYPYVVSKPLIKKRRGN